MKKIQVIGLPGAGKTTGIQLFNQQDLVSFLDIRSFNLNKEQGFIKAIRDQGDLIAESSCGVDAGLTYIVKLEVEKTQLLKNLSNRGEKLGPYYIQCLKDQMLPANYVVHSTYDLAEILKTIFKR